MYVQIYLFISVNFVYFVMSHKILFIVSVSVFHYVHILYS